MRTPLLSPSSSTVPGFTPVVLAGGSGTRFWPRSRRTQAKQVLALDGERTMIQQTIDRLRPLAPVQNMWIVANDGVAGAIRNQVPEAPRGRLICEPVARNTAPACGLAAFLTMREDPDAVVGIFPSDHIVRDQAAFQRTLRDAIDLASQGPAIVVLGVPPSHPETGYGYIELATPAAPARTSATPVLSFTEKPDLASAEAMVASNRFAWNSGMFVMKAKTLCDALYEHAPHIAAPLEAVAETFGTPGFEELFETVYSSCQNISLDYAVMEPQARKSKDANMFCLPANFGWNDLGSWSALHEHRRACDFGDIHSNVVEGPAASAIQSRGNYVYAPGRHVALLGVQNLVVVLTDDAVLVTTRDHAQDVGAVVRHLSEAGQTQLL